MGKNQRRRKQQKLKERSTSIIFDLGENPPEVSGMSYTTDGKISLETDQGPVLPVRAWVEKTYRRPKGEKVLTRIDVPIHNPTFSPELALTQFAWVFAVDTNRPTVDAAVTFTGVVQAQVTQVTPHAVQTGIARDCVIEIHNNDYSAERFGWWLVISSVVNRPSHTRIGIIVDAHLSELPAINLREQPVLGKNYLPEGFQLLYASSDAPNDSIANRLLRRADRNAREIAVIYGRDDVPKPPPVEAPEGGPRSYIRTWEKTRSG